MSIQLRRTLWLSFVLFAAQLLIGLLVSPLPAHAAIGDLECAAAFQFNFDPPLTATNTTGHPTASAVLVDCESPNGQYSDLRSANVNNINATVTDSAGPCNLLITITGSARFDWNTGEHSTLNFTINTNPLNGNITLSATINSGPLKGDTVNAAPVVAHPNVDCLLAGLETLTAELAVVVFG